LELSFHSHANHFTCLPVLSQVGTITSIKGIGAWFAFYDDLSIQIGYALRHGSQPNVHRVIDRIETLPIIFITYDDGVTLELDLYPYPVGLAMPGNVCQRFFYDPAKGLFKFQCQTLEIFSIQVHGHLVISGFPFVDILTQDNNRTFYLQGGVCISWIRNFNS
jgi:hypothetical protein